MENFDKILSGEKTGVLPTLIRAALWGASQPYSTIMTLRNWCFDRGWLKAHRASLPVLSVGNLTVGGTGKTPAVTFLAKWFRARQIRVAVVSRGYRAGADGVNDEAKEMETKLPDVPHLQNPNRWEASRIAADELDSQLVLLDDGFQHRRLHRDLSIVLIDALLPFGYGHLLPRGLLREPKRSLGRADVVMVTRADLVEPQVLANIRTQIHRYAPKAAWVETEHQPKHLRNSRQSTLPISWLQGKKVLAFCGLGNPKGFISTLGKLGVEILQVVPFPDHHAYSSSDLQHLMAIGNTHPEAAAWICTGKDLAKIGVELVGRHPLWSLDIELHIRFGIEALEDRLNDMLKMIPVDDPTELDDSLPT